MKTFTIIGAGGIFTHGLFAHLGAQAEAVRRALGGISLRFALVDTDARRLDGIVRFARHVVEQSGLAAEVRIDGYAGGEEAFRHTDLVLLIRPFLREETINAELAERHGIPGGHEGPACLGLARLVLGDVERAARLVRRHGAPGARLIVFSNPTDVLAQATQARTGVETWGWCGAPDSLRESMAGLLGVEPDRVTRLRSVGVNHFGYVTELEMDGRPALDRLRAVCAERVRHESSARMKLWLEWTRDTGWPYLTMGHPAPWNEAPSPPRVWTNPESVPMYAAIHEELGRPHMQLRRLLDVFGWEGTTGLAMVRLVGALWGQGELELGWQSHHGGTVPGLPCGGWLERTMRVRRGVVQDLDFRALPEELAAPLRLAAIQQRALGRAVAEDSRGQALEALAINPFACGMTAARAYVDDVWNLPVRASG